MYGFLTADEENGSGVRAALNFKEQIKPSLEEWVKNNELYKQDDDEQNVETVSLKRWQEVINNYGLDFRYIMTELKGSGGEKALTEASLSTSSSSVSQDQKKNRRGKGSKSYRRVGK